MIQNIHVIPALVPLDVTTTGTEIFTDVFNMGKVVAFEFHLATGAITTDNTIIKVYEVANTTASGGDAITFHYKKSSALGTDASAAWATSAALTLTAVTDNNIVVRIAVVPAELSAAHPYVYLGIDPGEAQTVGFYSVVAVSIPNYDQSIPPSIVT